MRMRKAKTVTIDHDVLREIEITKGKRSTSDRLNEVLRAGLEAERGQKVDAEIASFFAKRNDDRADSLGFQQASIRAVSRE